MSLKKIHAALQMLLLASGLVGLCPVALSNTTVETGNRAPTDQWYSPNQSLVQDVVCGDSTATMSIQKAVPYFQIDRNLAQVRTADRRFEVLNNASTTATTLMPKAFDALERVEVSGGSGSGTTSSGTLVAPILLTQLSGRPKAAHAVRMGLLLPLRSPTLKAAAQAVRDGFQVAYARDPGRAQLAIIETDDVAANIARAYQQAVSNYDILIGPLSRSAVSVLASSAAVSRPTIALTQPDLSSEPHILLPPLMLVMGLSIEQQARQAVDWALREHTGSKSALVLSTNVAWQKRAARALINQLHKAGVTTDVMELSVSSNMLDSAALSEVKKRLQGDHPASLLLVALDAAQTQQLRGVIDSRVPVYGTAQLNPLSPTDIASSDHKPELDGVRLIDMPWQLQADHPAVMIYPRSNKPGELRRGPDLERLYALGIDAYRVATEISRGRTAFAIDGVTGKLNVQLDGIHSAIFERTEQPAVYSGGIPIPVATTPSQ
jgi:outer membrane PBP1 activator LpoA protein